MSVVKSITESDFDEAMTSNPRPVLVDLWAEWCGPCKALAPTLEKVGAQFEGKVDFVKINVDEHPAIRDRLSVRGIPTLLLMKNGEEIGRVVGNRSAGQLAGFLDQRLGTVTALPALGTAPVQAFKGDAALKADSRSRLQSHIAAKVAAPDEPMWDAPAFSALSFICGSTDPDDQVQFLGLPHGAIAMAEALASAYQTHRGVAEYIDRWLGIVEPGVNYSTLPARFMPEALNSSLVSSLVLVDTRLADIRDKLVAMHQAVISGAVPSESDWAGMRQACKSVSSDPQYEHVAGLLEAAACAFPGNTTDITDFISAAVLFQYKRIMRESKWTGADDGTFHELASTYSNALVTQGLVPPRGSALCDELEKTHPDFIRRFRAVHDGGQLLLKDAGRTLAELFLNVTAAMALLEKTSN
jgi:thioredoxin